MSAFRSARGAFGAVAIICLSPLGFASGLTAQQAHVEVAGTVTVAGTGVALPAATIRIVELHRDARSHEDGRFVFAAVPAGRYQLVVQRIGYRALTQELVVGNTPVQLTIALREAPVQLAASVVTGQISERGSADAITATSVLSDAKLERKLDGTLGATVAGTPGVSVTSMGPATARPVLRGMSGDRVLILEDGMRPGDLSSTSMDHAVAMDPLTAQKIEVVRGPMSLLYGSSALGGVVNMIRQEVPTTLAEHLHGTLSAQASSANSGGTLGGFAEMPLFGLTVRGEGSARMAGDMRTPMGTLNNTDVQSANASVGASLVKDWGYTGVSYRFFTNDYGLPGGFVGAHPNGVDISMTRHMVRSETDWHPRDGRFESVKASLSFTDYEHSELTNSGNVAVRFEQLMSVGELIVRHRPTGLFSSGAFGVRAQYRDITTAGALRTPSTSDWSAAGFVIEEADVGALRLQAGARYDVARFTPLERAEVTVGTDTIPAAERTFGALSASVGALYKFENGLRLGASASQSYRTPDFNELYSDGPHLAAYSYDVGNPRIRRETGLGAEMFARLERERLRVEVAAFTNRMDGYIFPRNTGELGRQGERWKFQYVNEDATLIGAEGEFEWTIAQHIVFDGTMSYVRGTIRGDRDTIPGINGEPDVLESQYLPLMPPLNGRVGLRHETPRWSFGGAMRWAAAQERLGDFETVTDAYATGDVFASWRLLLGGRLHSITLKVDNLLDTEIRDHLSRTKDIIPETGRNVSLLYRVQF
jgi:iron complex outermembrane receptor protein